MLKTEKFIPSNIQKIGSALLHIIAIPLYCAGFTMIYNPFQLETTLDYPYASFHFNVLMCACIMIVTYLISRMTLYTIRKSIHLTWNWYILVGILEIIFMSFFIALYIWLISTHAHTSTYLGLVFVTFAILTSIIAIPFTIIALALTLKYKENQEYLEEEIDSKRIRFYDEKHNLKLVVQNNAIHFIEADENYVNIHYAEGEKMRVFSLRSSMKAIEEVCNENKIVRCHRSYFVNPKHIKVLRKEKEGVTYAEMDNSTNERIPVSKKYYNQIIELI